MTAARVEVENGSTLADYQIGVDTVTHGGGTANVPLSKIVDAAAGSVVGLSVVAEDAASAGGEGGLVPLAVRRDAPSSDVSAAGDFATLQVDAEGSLRVVPTRRIVTVDVDLSGVTTASTAYTAADALGSVVTATGMAAAAGRHCTILSAVFVDGSDVMGPFDVHFFNAAPTATTDNAAYAPSDADALTIVGTLSFGGFIDLGGTRVSQLIGGGLPLTMKTAASANLSCVFVTRYANSYFGSGVTERLRLTVEQH